MSESGGCWPTADQELLLRAALLSGDDARRAWEACLARLPDLETLDSGSLRLLPLLYTNLRALGVDHPRLALLKGTYRKAWYQNTLLLRDLAALLRALHAAGVPTMILKGAALVHGAYPDVATRPMGDVDVLVPVDDAERGIDVLRRAGLRPTHPVTRHRLPLVHSVGFEGPSGRKVDLHWHLVEEDCRPGADEGFWERSVAVTVEGVQTRALDATDQLFHACVHGVRWQREPPLRWVADATVVVRAGQVDWDRLVALGERHRLVLPLLHALAYLDSRRLVAVPSSAQERLAALPTAAWERRELRLKTLPHTYFRRLQFHWYNHRRLVESARFLVRLRSFPHYLLARWGLEGIGEAPAFIHRELRARRAAGRRRSAGISTP